VTTGPLDLKKLDAYRARAGEFRVLTVPPQRYLAIDGHGDPNTDGYRRAIETIYPVAYRLKFASKRAGRDYVVMPLEALWSAEDPSLFTSRRDKSTWDWTLLTAVPDWITPDDVAAVSTDVRLEELEEGLCVQTLHLGPYDDEGPVLAKMHDEVIPGEGLVLTARHHEIYLSDARRVAPEKLRTILRQPVARA
jgi:Uncharacterized conserved protein